MAWAITPLEYLYKEKLEKTVKALSTQGWYKTWQKLVVPFVKSRYLGDIKYNQKLDELIARIPEEMMERYPKGAGLDDKDPFLDKNIHDKPLNITCIRILRELLKATLKLYETDNTFYEEKYKAQKITEINKAIEAIRYFKTSVNLPSEGIQPDALVGMGVPLAYISHAQGKYFIKRVIGYIKNVTESGGNWTETEDYAIWGLFPGQQLKYYGAVTFPTATHHFVYIYGGIICEVGSTAVRGSGILNTDQLKKGHGTAVGKLLGKVSTAGWKVKMGTFGLSTLGVTARFLQDFLSYRQSSGGVLEIVSFSDDDKLPIMASRLGRAFTLLGDWQYSLMTMMLYGIDPHKSNNCENAANFISTGITTSPQSCLITVGKSMDEAAVEVVMGEGDVPACPFTAPRFLTSRDCICTKDVTLGDVPESSTCITDIRYNSDKCIGDSENILLDEGSRETMINTCINKSGKLEKRGDYFRDKHPNPKSARKRDSYTRLPGFRELQAADADIQKDIQKQQKQRQSPQARHERQYIQKMQKEADARYADAVKEYEVQRSLAVATLMTLKPQRELDILPVDLEKKAKRLEKLVQLPAMTVDTDVLRSINAELDAYVGKMKRKQQSQKSQKSLQKALEVEQARADKLLRGTIWTYPKKKLAKEVEDAAYTLAAVYNDSREVRVSEAVVEKLKSANDYLDEVDL